MFHAFLVLPLVTLIGLLYIWSLVRTEVPAESKAHNNIKLVVMFLLVLNIVQFSSTVMGMMSLGHH